MTVPQRKPTPEQHQNLAPEIESLVWGLFKTTDQPFFDGSDCSPTALNDFVHCDEVFDETFRFLDGLTAIWNARNPGRPLRPLSSASSTDAAPALPDQSLMLPDKTDPDADHETAGMNTPLLPTLSESVDQPQPNASVASTPVTMTKPGQVPPASARPTPPATVPTVRFYLPNGRVGVDYAARIDGQIAGRPVRITEVRMPDALGLSFDAAQGELHGIPTSAGEHQLRLRWTLDDREVYSGACLLIINPDPKSLWQVNEPAADAPYPKPHVAQALLTGQGFRIAAASRRGRSHEHAGTFRDDDVLISRIPETDWALMLVADGAGSAIFSREGSRLAVATASDSLIAALSGATGDTLTAALTRWETDPDATQTIGSACHGLFHDAARLAVQSIEQEAQTQCAEIRDYATTLLAAIVNRHGDKTFLATFWMGDGAIAAYGPRGKVRLMGTPDGGEFAGQTRFLDRAALVDQGFAKRIGIGRFADLTAILLMTDGVSDPRFETDNGLNDPARWDALWDDLEPLLATSEPSQSLCDWLHFFTPGHHDDRTLAVLW